jgi:putative membrane protein
VDEPLDRDVVKGALAGLIGGLVASWVMTQFTDAWTRAAPGHESTPAGVEQGARPREERSEDQNANEIIAQRLAVRALGRRLTRDELGVAAPAVHYAFGAGMGAAYGAAAEAVDPNPLTGAAWGALVWLGADRIAMPLIDASQGPGAYTPEQDAQGLAAHVVYRDSTEIVRWGVRRLI